MYACTYVYIYIYIYIYMYVLGFRAGGVHCLQTLIVCPFTLRILDMSKGGLPCDGSLLRAARRQAEAGPKASRPALTVIKAPVWSYTPVKTMS